MFNETVNISRPDRCQDCYCWHNDSDEGGICGYSGESVDGGTEVTKEALDWRDCLFSDEHRI